MRSIIVPILFPGIFIYLYNLPYFVAIGDDGDDFPIPIFGFPRSWWNVWGTRAVLLLQSPLRSRAMEAAKFRQLLELQSWSPKRENR